MPPSIELDFVVSVDIYRNETTRHANVILPPPSSLERSEYHMAFFALAVHNYAEWSPPLFEADGPDEHEILAMLALHRERARGRRRSGDHRRPSAERPAEPGPESRRLPHRRSDLDELRGELFGPSAVDQLVDAMIRTGQYGDWFGARPDGMSLESLADNPHGVDLGPLQPRFPAALRTVSGTIELASEPIADEIDRLASSLDARPDEQIVLVGRRHLRSNNSWMHNVNVLVKGKDRCTLQVHPDDAQRLGLTDGASANVASASGAVVAPVEVTDAIRPGVVSLPHGWGHDRPGASMGVAAAHAGVNSNMLTDGSILDPLSGNAVLERHPGGHHPGLRSTARTMAAMEIAIESAPDADLEELRQLNGAIRIGTAERAVVRHRGRPRGAAGRGRRSGPA